jgi:hypothetical protein
MKPVEIEMTKNFALQHSSNADTHMVVKSKEMNKVESKNIRVRSIKIENFCD